MNVNPNVGLSTTLNPQGSANLPKPMKVNPATLAGANPPANAKPIAPPSRTPPVGGPPVPKLETTRTKVENRLIECSKAPAGRSLTADDISSCMSKKGFKKSKNQHTPEEQKDNKSKAQKEIQKSQKVSALSTTSSK